MQMRVDEAGDDDFAARLDLADARVFLHSPDDAVAADGYVRLDQRAADEIEQPGVFDDEIGGRVAPPLRYGAGEEGGGGETAMWQGMLRHCEAPRALPSPTCG